MLISVYGSAVFGALGSGALQSNTYGHQNTAVGASALGDLTTGGNNVALGYFTGIGISTGRANTLLGTNIRWLAADLSNTVIIADGDGNRRIVADANGNVGIGSENLTHAHTLTVSGTIGLEGNPAIHPDYVFNWF